MKKGFAGLAASCLILTGTTSAFAAEGYADKVAKFEREGLTVHSYNSTEGMRDGSFIFETAEALVVLEPQSMPGSIEEFKKYVESLNKPVKAVIVSYHGAGLSHYAGIPIYASKATIEFAESGAEKKMLDNFAETNPGFDTTVIVPGQALEAASATIEGIDFALFYDNSPFPGMTVAIPSSKVVYLHMLGADTHSILFSPEHIEAFITQLKGLKDQGYELILSSHHTPETAEALDQKIAYLEKTKEILKEAKTKEEFVTAMNATFPDYYGDHFVTMSAGRIYK